jgi:excisionase family DNA binding protein
VKLQRRYTLADNVLAEKRSPVTSHAPQEGLSNKYKLICSLTEGMLMKANLKKDDSLSQGNFLTLREAADILRLTPRTVREYVTRGEIQGRIIGGRWRFRRADLDAFFDNAPRTWDFK